MTKKEIPFSFALTWMLAYFAITPRDIGQTHRIQIEQRIFSESAIRLQNPYRGFVPMACQKGKSTVPFSTVYSFITWRELEPSEGKLRWDLLEKCWAQHFKEGRRVAFRFQVLSPNEETKRSYPHWFIEKYKLKEKSYSIDGIEGLVFDWNHPKFLKAHHRIINEMAKRYDKNPNIAWIEVGSYGFWGEWHMHENSELVADFDTRKKIYNDYHDAFKSVPLVISFDDKEITKIALSDKHSLRNDCLGPKFSNNHFERTLASITPSLLEDSHQNIFTNSELCGGPAKSEQYLYDLSRNNYALLKQQGISTIGPNGAELIFNNDQEIQETIKQINHSLGYNFVLRRSQYTSVLMPEDDFEIEVKIENTGSANIPDITFDTVISFESSIGKSTLYAETNEEWDAAHWDPGVHILKFKYPAYLLNPGEYKVFISLIDRRNKKSRIKFSNVHQLDKSKIEIGSFKIIGQADHEQ